VTIETRLTKLEAKAREATAKISDSHSEMRNAKPSAIAFPNIKKTEHRQDQVHRVRRNGSLFAVNFFAVNFSSPRGTKEDPEKSCGKRPGQE